MHAFKNSINGGNRYQSTNFAEWWFETLLHQLDPPPPELYPPPNEDCLCVEEQKLVARVGFKIFTPQ